MNKLFIQEDRFYHDANNTCHVCNKTCIEKIEIAATTQGKSKDQHFRYVI